MSISVLDKAFSVVETLARAGRPLTLAEVGEEGRLPKPTVHRILRSLRDLGYVQQADRGGAYALSPRLASLREHSRDDAVRRRAGPLLERVHRQFDETVNLGLLEGLYVRYAQVRETSQPLRWIVKPGARDSFRTTALGRAIVAGLPAETQGRLIAKVCAALPSRRRSAGRADLERALAETRARGWAFEDEETVSGVACVAVSLAPLGEPLAAISVSVPSPRLPPERRAALVAGLLAARDELAATA